MRWLSKVLTVQFAVSVSSPTVRLSVRLSVCLVCFCVEDGWSDARRRAALSKGNTQTGGERGW
eukprot:3029678-Pyramimonas_sp.AAC.1